MKAIVVEGRFRFLSLIASLAIFFVLRRVRIFERKDIYIGTNKTTKVALVNSIGFENFVLETKSSEKSITHELPKQRMVDNLIPANISIYLTDLSRPAYSMDYRYLASFWDRDTTYDDMLQQAASNATTSSSSSSAKESLQRKLKGNNITVIFHGSPKTASSTLRNACMETQYDTCNLPRKPEKMKWPEGYRTPKRLTQLFMECPDTRHFCVKDLPVTKNFTNVYDTRTFLHLFPFRNYDEWVTSALHQISYRDGEEGCQNTDELMNQCLPHKYELNFQRYTKFILAEFIKSFESLRTRRGERVKDHHHILIHNYLYLDQTLTWLNDNYGVPLLPGTERKINFARPAESCKDEESIIKKFHGCFTDELAELY